MPRPTARANRAGGGARAIADTASAHPGNADAARRTAAAFHRQTSGRARRRARRSSSSAPASSEEIAALRRGDAGRGRDCRRAPATRCYQNIQLQLNQIDVEIAALRVAARRTPAQRGGAAPRGRHRARGGSRIRAPDARLRRHQDAVQQRCSSASRRARVSGDAAQTGVVRFNIVDPPTAAFKPDVPESPAAAHRGAVLRAWRSAPASPSCMHMLRPVFSSARSLTELTGLPVLGAVIARPGSSK